MARGFTGKSAEKFFSNTSEALGNAGKAHVKKPFEGRSEGVVPLPRLPATNNRQAPFEAEDAWSDNHRRNVGNSSNIVVEPYAGEPAPGRVNYLDTGAGEELYNVCNFVEEMCKTIYVVPETIQGVYNISEEFKGSLGEFRSHTEEINICIRNFMIEASQIDFGNNGLIAMEERAAEQNINRVSNTIDMQATSMDNTAMNYKMQAEGLRQKAQAERAAAGSLTGGLPVPGIG